MNEPYVKAVGNTTTLLITDYKKSSEITIEDDKIRLKDVSWSADVHNTTGYFTFKLDGLTILDKIYDLEDFVQEFAKTFEEARYEARKGAIAELSFTCLEGMAQKIAWVISYWVMP
jgi:hypothetical protein